MRMTLEQIKEREARLRELLAIAERYPEGPRNSEWTASLTEQLQITALAKRQLTDSRKVHG